MKLIKVSTPKLLLTSLVLYLASTLVAYRVFSTNSQPPPLTTGYLPPTNGSPAPTSKFKFDPQAPKTEVSPLNGVKFSKEEMNFLADRRPLGIMVENHPDARPQSGLSSADLVYEAVAEGGITRFMAIYWGALDDIGVAPVRSARTYFLNWISEYDGLYAHVGGANCNEETGSGCANGAPADALGQIIKYQIKSLNQYNVGYPTYVRDYERLSRTVATEHTMVSSTDSLWQAAVKFGWTATTEDGSWTDKFRPWQFKDDPPVSERPPSQEAEFGFWEGSFGSEFNVRWVYDPQTNSYLRFMAGAPHTDLNNNQQLRAKDVAILFMNESSANDGYPDNVHLLYGTIGGGKAIFLQDGKKTEGTWEKESRLDRTLFYDLNNQEISLTRGPIWIEILPTGNLVTIK